MGGHPQVQLEEGQDEKNSRPYKELAKRQDKDLMMITAKQAQEQVVKEYFKIHGLLTGSAVYIGGSHREPCYSARDCLEALKNDPEILKQVIGKYFTREGGRFKDDRGNTYTNEKYCIDAIINGNYNSIKAQVQQKRKEKRALNEFEKRRMEKQAQGSSHG